ncbi:beta-ketoacyl-[acyl-carrier-protein] synthase family protein [Burkholderia pyrrocinia]|uniref:Nodulation protein E n=1 Tax=Burkholderia pyrrocinia TaxID=60550 RepID=A0ABZ3BN66_BURPY
MRRRVVISGIGLVGPLGLTSGSFFRALVGGVNGIRRHPDQSIQRHVGYVDLDLSENFSQTQRRTLDRVTLLAMYAASEAIEMARLGNGDVSRDCGVFVGTGIGGVISLAEGIGSFHGVGSRNAILTVPAAMPHACAANVAMMMGATAEAQTYSSACSAGAVAIGEAYRRIRDGYQDIALCGGSEALITPPILEAWAQLRVLCVEPENDPTTGCRPFSASRSGFALAEGAGMLVLEDREHAIGRGVAPIAEVVGYGVSNDATHLTRPDPAGQTLAVERAIKDAGIDACAIGYVNAHGSGTRIGDLIETRVLKSVFGKHQDRVAVSGTKSAHGHLIGAAGAVEFAICALALRNQVLPPTLHFDGDDPYCDLDYVSNRYRMVDGLQYAMSNSFGMGGNNVVLIATRC